jgi:hypothetical protein
MLSSEHKTLRRFLTASIVAIAFVSVLASTALAAPAPRAIQTQRSGQEIVNLSPAVCAQLKAANPARANAPTLCQFIHGWTVASTGTRSPNSACWNGYKSFRDWYTGSSFTYAWTMNLDTTFYYPNVNTCNANPILTDQRCYFSRLDHATKSDVGCYSYTYHSQSGWYSKAAVYSAQITAGGSTIYFSQRRECYNFNQDACNWTAWQGL